MLNVASKQYIETTGLLKSGRDLIAISSDSIKNFPCILQAYKPNSHHWTNFNTNWICDTVQILLILVNILIYLYTHTEICMAIIYYSCVFY